MTRKKNKTTMERMTEIIPRIKRPFRFDEMVYFIQKQMEMEGVILEKPLSRNTVNTYLMKLLNDGVVEKVEYDGKRNLYHLPIETVTYEIPISVKMDLPRDMEDESKGYFGQRYECFVNSDDLIGMTSITKNLFNERVEVGSNHLTLVNGVYKEFKKIKVDEQATFFPIAVNVVMHCYKNEIEYEHDESTGKMTIKTFKNGAITPFFTMAGWDVVERLRKNYVAKASVGIIERYPIHVSIIITDFDEDTVNTVKEAYLFIGEERLQQKKIDKEMLEQVEEYMRVTEIQEDEERKETWDALAEEEKRIKEEIKELNARLRDIKDEKDDL